MSEREQVQNLLIKQIYDAHPVLSDEEAKYRFLHPNGERNYLITDEIRKGQNPNYKSELELQQLADALEKFYEEAKKAKFDEEVKKAEQQSGKPGKFKFPSARDFVNAYNLYVNRNGPQSGYFNGKLVNDYFRDQQTVAREYERAQENLERLRMEELNNKAKSARAKANKKKKSKK